MVEVVRSFDPQVVTDLYIFAFKTQGADSVGSAAGVWPFIEIFALALCVGSALPD
jgi:hypothetical protein